MVKKNYFLNLARTRKTTYAFNDRAIKDSDIKKILEAGRLAPSFQNRQPWHFIVVKNKKHIDELMKTAFYGHFHVGATLIIAIVLERGHWTREDYRGTRNEKIGITDTYLSAAMPALSMIFEAQELGIGSAMLSPKEKDAAKILGTREGDGIPLLISFGYEKEGAFQKKSERKKLSQIVSYERFRRDANGRK